jgi:hypothetical protein
VEDIIGGRYRAVAGQIGILSIWLDELRQANLLARDSGARWRRIVDGLASAGDNRAARRQESEE